jgi:folate-binding protein YgfZ
MQPRSTLLPDWSVLPVSGPDAAAFLQAQLMNDVRALADRHWHWTGWLTPKGRVRFVGMLLRATPTQFFLVVPDWTSDELAEALRRFVFRSKVAVETTGVWGVAGDMPGPCEAASSDRAAETSSGWSLDAGAGAQARTLRLIAPTADAGSAGPEPAGFAEAWRAADLAFGLPRLAPAQREAYTPQMLSLERLRAFSLAKGCYPGQEIVSRTHYLGQAKRGLELVEGDGLAAGEDVRDAAGAMVGTLASVAAQGRLALAVLARERAPGDLHTGTSALRARPLAEGLQRPV